MNIITVANQKGGVAKTTIVTNLADTLSRMNKKILVIDLDPQANTTDILLQEQFETRIGSWYIFDTETSTKPEEIMLNSRMENIDVLASSLWLTEKETNVSIINSYNLVEIFLKMIIKKYDYCIIDTPPNLGLFALNALVASDYVLIPTELERFAVSGLNSLLTTIGAVQKSNSKLKILGIVPVKADFRLTLHKEMLEALKKKLGSVLLENLTININTDIAKAAAKREVVYEFDTRARSVKQFKKLAEFIVKVAK